MQEDFHYYATYCAAYLAGYSHEESMDICYGAQLVDLCSRTFLKKLRAPLSAATTQLQLELMDAPTDRVGLQDITRIWASFHFLPYDLYAEKKHCSKRYLDKYRLICNSNGALVKDTVMLAKDRDPGAVGIAMHVLADTWAHKYFAGTPSLVINNTNYYFFELLAGRGRQIKFRHNASAPDDPDIGSYISTIYQNNENSIMNLGHGRAGHLPDYSYIRYMYLPAWGDYSEVVKDNPSDYYHAFCQMIYAMQYLRGEHDEFELDRYAWDAAEPYKVEIQGIIEKRRLDASGDWRAFGQRLSGKKLEPFELNKYTGEYIKADAAQRDDTYLGRFIIAALRQKSMVTNKIYTSKNKLAGFSVDYNKRGFKGIKDFRKLLDIRIEEVSSHVDASEDI